MIYTLLTQVRDEILYHAKLHPEQYSDTFSLAQLKQLHSSIMYVCQTAVDALGDSSKFPDEWLFKHRWGKGKKDSSSTLPNGAKITFVTVGGRTSCIVPSVQKKTGPVAGDVKTEDRSGDEETKTNGKTSKKRKAGDESADSNVEVGASKRVSGKGRGKKSEVVDDDAMNAEQEALPHGETKKRKAALASTAPTDAAEKDSTTTAGSRRRSGRASTK
jgi:formamidopyrimidine-DNA glycosylase